MTTTAIPNRTWLLLLFLSIGLGGNAQSACETLQDRVDEFTGDRTLVIAPPVQGPGPALQWTSHNGSIALSIEWTRTDPPAVVFEDDTLMLKLENEQVIVLRSTRTMVGRTLLNDAGITEVRGTYVYSVSTDQLALLGHHWVQKARIYFRDGHDEFEASTDPAWQMGLWKSANCLQLALGLKAAPEAISGFEDDPGN